MDKTIDLINNLKDIPAMPHVIVKVLRMLHSEKAGVPELANLVRCDQALCTKLLALVNSAYYGFGKHIVSINMAISLLGFKKTMNLIIAVAMNPLLSFQGAKSLWYHSLYTAAGCEYIAEKYKLINPDDAFVMGFLHDIGKIVLNLIDSERYQTFMSNDIHPDLNIQDERLKFETDHSSTGSLLAARWQLPESIKDAIRYHHYPLKVENFVGPAIVNIVNILVQEKYQDEWFDGELAKMIKLNVDDVSALREEIFNRGNILIKELSS